MNVPVQRIKGLDSIRFICALWVMLGHFGLPLPESFIGPNTHGSLNIIGILIQLVFNGPAAVIVFFLISGFCIHYPYRNNYRIFLPAYYSRRLIRIGLPALIAIVAYKSFGKNLEAPSFGVFWSIICEVIYYLLYPLLLNIRKSMSWKIMILTSFFFAYFLAFANLDRLRTHGGGYASFGILTWIIGLPCWLMGCWLAEYYQIFPSVSFRKMWAIRSFILLLSLIFRIATFHISSVFASNGFTLNIFSIFACIWLGVEIVYFQKKEPFKVLEWSGKWSYSLYVMHPLVSSIIIALGLGSTLIFQSKYLFFVFVFIISFLFYVVVEFPSHRFAVYISKLFKKKPIFSKSFN
jgi:peptidoglycan/LPS O-acetylase OafA/YrhL